MKVIISNMAWIEKSSFKNPSEIFLLRNKCTIIPTANTHSGELAKPIKMYRETADYFGMPRHYYRKYGKRFSDEDTEVIYDVSNGIPLTPNSRKIVLREYDQEPVAQDLIKALTTEEWGCGLVEAFTAFGKTVVAIEVVNRLGGNALILVHSQALKDQWIERIREFYPNARIGEVQGPVCNYKDKDIVIGMVQSIMTDSDLEHPKYPREFYQYFRTLVVDEVHRFAAFSFSKAAPKFNTKYSFGVSGTIRRNDGCMDVFRWTLGDIVASADESMRVKPVVCLVETGCQFPREERQVTNKNGTVRDAGRAELLNHIAEQSLRNKKIAADIIRALRQGRNPLVMAERKSLLEDVAKYVDAFAKVDPVLAKSISHGFYIGGKSKEELEAAARCDVVYATIQLAKEGIDIPRLETLFMATPLSDVEQLVGRVCRPKIKWVDGKPVIMPKLHEAMVIDYIDGECGLFRVLSYKRQSQYRKLGWKVIDRRK